MRRKGLDGNRPNRVFCLPTCGYLAAVGKQGAMVSEAAVGGQDQGSVFTDHLAHYCIDSGILFADRRPLL